MHRVVRDGPGMMTYIGDTVNSRIFAALAAASPAARGSVRPVDDCSTRTVAITCSGGGVDGGRKQNRCSHLDLGDTPMKRTRTLAALSLGLACGGFGMACGSGETATFGGGIGGSSGQGGTAGLGGNDASASGGSAGTAGSA